MKMKSLMILVIGVVAISASAMSVSADEIIRAEEKPNDVLSIDEQDSGEPILIAPNPNIEPLEGEVSGDGEIIPLYERGEAVPMGDIENDGSEPMLISGLDTGSEKSSDTSASNTPVILILGAVGLLVILLLVINRKK